MGGGTRSLRLPEVYQVAWRNSVDAETFQRFEFTPVPFSHSTATGSLRWHKITPRAKDHLYGLQARAYFEKGVKLKKIFYKVISFSETNKMSP
jgi:hypothetical protein